MGSFRLEIGSKGKPKLTSMALFSGELLNELFDVFFDFKEHFTIRKLDKLSVYGRKIENYNRMMIDELNKSLKKSERNSLADEDINFEVNDDFHEYYKTY